MSLDRGNEGSISLLSSDMRLRTLSCIALLLLWGVSVRGQQQIVDPDFRAVVEHPAYRRSGPTVAIDEAHSNFHTLGGQYKPFADLLTNDGYKVIASNSLFKKESTNGIDVLVIANARNLTAIVAGDISKPAFTEEECDVVQDWVRRGGSLLLIADHAPFGNAAESLAKRFGVTMGKGWAFDRASTGGVTTQLIFSRANGLLGAHPILRGRNSSEEIRSITSFTGQSIGAPPRATMLMKLSETAREATTPDDLDAVDAAVRATGNQDDAIGAHSSPVAGRAQGIAMTFGKGRIVVLGEAGLLSAQIVRFGGGDQAEDMKFGMNVPGNDDRQFALNLLHWLSGLLK
jgi:hypothetical protein